MCGREELKKIFRANVEKREQVKLNLGTNIYCGECRWCDRSSGRPHRLEWLALSGSVCVRGEKAARAFDRQAREGGRSIIIIGIIKNVRGVDQSRRRRTRSSAAARPEVEALTHERN